MSRKILRREKKNTYEIDRPLLSSKSDFNEIVKESNLVSYRFKESVYRNNIVKHWKVGIFDIILILFFCFILFI